MHDLVIALVYLGILLLPIVLATKNTPDLGKDDYEPEPETFRSRQI